MKDSIGLSERNAGNIEKIVSAINTVQQELVKLCAIESFYQEELAGDRSAAESSAIRDHELAMQQTKQEHELQMARLKTHGKIALAVLSGSGAVTAIVITIMQAI